MKSDSARQRRSATRNSVDSGGLDTPRRRYHAPNWVASATVTSGDIPAYRPEADPYNPRAIARASLSKTRSVPSLGTQPEAEANPVLRKRYREVSEFLAARPPKAKAKGAKVTMQSARSLHPDTERGVLELILAREAYVEDLRRFLPRFKGGLSQLQKEHVHLLADMLRELGLQVVEAVQAWRAAQGVAYAVTDTGDVGKRLPPLRSKPPPFMYQTENYLCRMANDLAFLDSFPVACQELGACGARNPLLQPTPMHERAWTPREPNRLLRDPIGDDEHLDTLPPTAENVLRQRVDSAERLILREEDYVEAARVEEERLKEESRYRDPPDLPLLPHRGAADAEVAPRMPASPAMSTQERTKKGPHASAWRVPPMHELKPSEREERMVVDIAHAEKALQAHAEELELRKEKLRAAASRLSGYERNAAGLNRRERKRAAEVRATMQARAAVVERLTIEHRQRCIELTRKRQLLEDTRKQIEAAARRKAKARQFKRYTRAAVRIQTAWRMHRAGGRVSQLRSALLMAATRIQAVVRVAMAKKELLRLKSVATERKTAAVAVGVVQLVDCTCEQVQRLLAANGLVRYCDKFADLRIDGSMLCDADGADLDELGLQRQHKKRLLGLVERLRRQGVDVTATVRAARAHSERFVARIQGRYLLFHLRPDGHLDAFALTPFELLARGLRLPAGCLAPPTPGLLASETAVFRARTWVKANARFSPEGALYVTSSSST